MSAWEEDVRAVQDLTPRTPDVAIVLGSGLDAVSKALEQRIDIGYERLVGMRGDEVTGHAGVLSLGEIAGRQVACFRGRHHLYQGFSAHEVAYPVRLAAQLGARTLVVTNAAGSVGPEPSPGTTMLITDHINLTGHNPLVGWSGGPEGAPFVTMADAYDADLRALARARAEELGITLAQGVYAGVLGPSFETPAEVECLRRAGADAVGMSTVCEVIAARALGLRVLGFSSIANAAGVVGLSHVDVLSAVERGAEDLARLVAAILAGL